MLAGLFLDSGFKEDLYFHINFSYFLPTICFAVTISITFYFLTISALKITVMETEAAKFLMRFYHTLKMAQGHMDVDK